MTDKCTWEWQPISTVPQDGYFLTRNYSGSALVEWVANMFADAGHPDHQFHQERVDAVVWARCPTPEFYPLPEPRND